MKITKEQRKILPKASKEEIDNFIRFVKSHGYYLMDRPGPRNITAYFSNPKADSSLRISYDKFDEKWTIEFGSSSKVVKALKNTNLLQKADEGFDSFKQAASFVEKLIKFHTKTLKEAKNMKITKSQLREMVQKVVKRKLNESSKGYAYLEHLRSHMSDTQILEELVEAMSSAEAEENFRHIMDMWDISPFED